MKVTNYNPVGSFKENMRTALDFYGFNNDNFDFSGLEKINLDSPVKSEINYKENPFKLYSKERLPDFDLDEKPKRRNKSKQAYDILKSLDYEYDLVKQKWFKKVYIND